MFFKIFAISVSLFYVTSCGIFDGKNDESRKIKLNEISVNLKNKNKFISTSTNTDKNSRLQRSSNLTDSEISVTSLFVGINFSELESGLTSKYNFEVDKIYPFNDNKNAIITFSFDGSHDKFNDPKYLNLIALNCGMLNVNLTNNYIECLAPALVPLNHIENTLNSSGGDLLPSVQFGDNSIFFRTMWTEDFSPKPGLECSKYCLFKYNISKNTTEKIGDKNYEYSRFIALKNNQVLFTRAELTPSGDWETDFGELELMDEDGSTIELTDVPWEGGYSDGYEADDFITAIYQTPGFNLLEFTRYENKTQKTAYLPLPTNIRSLYKGKNGNLYGSNGSDGFYQILPKLHKIIDSPSYTKKDFSKSTLCNETMSCGVFYMLLDDVVVYTQTDISNSKHPLILKATRLSDNATVSLIKPNSTCTSHCFENDDYDYYFKGTGEGDYARWHKYGNTLFVDVIDLAGGDKKILYFDFDEIDFTKDNIYQTFETSGVFAQKEIKSISGLVEVEEPNQSPTVIFDLNNANDSIFSLEFSQTMDKFAVEKLISVKDTENNTIEFVPVWIQNKLHLILESDGVENINNTASPLPTPGTYSVKLFAGAIDTKGNSISSENNWTVTLQ